MMCSNSNEIQTNIFEYIDVELPQSINEINGQKLLHIGDTESCQFPYYKKIIEMVRPNIILHTGDMVDELKVGRISGLEKEYFSKLKILADIMISSGARLIIVPGNNDISEYITQLFPNAEIFNENSVVNIDGVECRIGHQSTNMTFDKEWNFYGHTIRKGEWDYEMNKSGNKRLFNARKDSYVCSIKEGIFDVIKLPKIN